jgi:hypothetical protein
MSLRVLESLTLLELDADASDECGRAEQLAVGDADRKTAARRRVRPIRTLPRESHDDACLERGTANALHPALTTSGWWHSPQISWTHFARCSVFPPTTHEPREMVMKPTACAMLSTMLLAFGACVAEVKDGDTLEPTEGHSLIAEALSSVTLGCVVTPSATGQTVANECRAEFPESVQGILFEIQPDLDPSARFSWRVRPGVLGIDVGCQETTPFCRVLVQKRCLAIMPGQPWTPPQRIFTATVSVFQGGQVIQAEARAIIDDVDCPPPEPWYPGPQCPRTLDPEACQPIGV